MAIFCRSTPNVHKITGGAKYIVKYGIASYSTRGDVVHPFLWKMSGLKKKNEVGDLPHRAKPIQREIKDIKNVFYMLATMMSQHFALWNNDPL